MNSNHIQSLDYDKVLRVLCDAKTRKPLVKGQEVFSFRGEKMRVVGGCPPHKPSSSGYIDVIFPDDHEDDVSPQSLYVSVFNCVWLGAQEITS